MKTMKGQIDGITVAKYRKGNSTDKNEINELIRKEIKDGFKRI